MQLDEKRLRSVPDAGVLHTLDSGIGIVRRHKHEPIDARGMSRSELQRKTCKENGSKFLAGTSLGRVVELTALILEENGAVPGDNAGYNRVFDEPIGISNGRPVRGLRVERSSRGTLAHAFPVDERLL